VSRSAFDEIGSKQGSEFGIEGWSEGPAFHDLGAIEIGESPAPRHALPARRPGAIGGRAAVKYVKQAVGLVRFGAARAVVTAPISKTSLRLAALPHPGHTEMLADLCGVPGDEVAMLFVTPQFKVALLSVHAPLRAAIASLSQERIVSRLALLHVEHGRWFGRDPRLALAALNPHAGEEGMFGDEERDILAPALEAARAAGVDARGPFPADTVFARAAGGEFDAVLALYHDQATIAVKTSAFGRAVNMTLGLPLLRTSVDHGTAWDIAGQGRADPSSMVEAILLAARLVPRA
jgi:4-hydroxythreonine-4-phosphate dehydrogenase